MSVAIVVIFCLRCAPQVPPDVEEELKDVLQRLDDASLDVRASAQKELERITRKLGSRAEEVLRREMEGGSTEVRGRLLEQLGWLARVAECRRLLGPFDQLRFPEVSGLRLVLYNTGEYVSAQRPDGPWIQFKYVLGWVMAESREQLKLYRNTLDIRTYRRAWTPPTNWTHLRKGHPQDRPLPCELQEIAYDKLCRELLALEGWALESEDFRRFCHSWYDARALEPALYAWWAFQCGFDQVGLDLVALGERAIRKAPRMFGTETRPMSEILIEGVADHLREQVIEDAAGKLPRPDLLEMWRRIKALPKNRWSTEAENMVSLYEKSIKEDAEWAELTLEDLASRSGRDRAEYWIHRLRDLAPGIYSQSGDCRVLDWGVLAPFPEGQSDAAHELERMGWKVLPALIDHFDDPHPTRAKCLEIHHHGIPPSWLLTVGDCCQIVFDAITLKDYSTWETATYASDRKEKIDSAKSRAEAWWMRDGVKGSAPYYLKLLDPKRSESTVFKAARNLIESNPDSELPRISALARKSEDWAWRRTLFSASSPYIGSKEGLFVELFLDDPEDTWTVPRAARVMWEHRGSEKGVQRVIERVDRLRAGRGVRSTTCCESCFLSGAQDLFPQVQRTFVADALARFLGDGDSDVRDMALRVASRFHHPTVASALARLLTDTSLFPKAGHGAKAFLEWKCSDIERKDIRLSDVACAALVSASGFTSAFPEDSELGERDAFITRFRAWWLQNQDKISWKALRE
jgi:hypothetical protein